MVHKNKGKKRKKAKKGEGIVDNVKALLFGRTKLPPKVRTMLKKHGDNEIDYIQVARNPLNTFTKLALDVVSLGEFSKKAKALPYDRLYHLYMIVTLKNGKNILLEKNEVIHTEYTGVRAKAESKMVRVNKSLTLNTLMANTKKRMGKDFLIYDGNKNNCQRFIMNILKGNNLGNETIYKFVKQDTRAIFKGSPTFSAIQRFTTDLASKIDVLRYGAGQRGGNIEKEDIESFFFAPIRPIYNTFKKKGGDYIDRENARERAREAKKITAWLLKTFGGKGLTTKQSGGYIAYPDGFPKSWSKEKKESMRKYLIRRANRSWTGKQINKNRKGKGLDRDLQKFFKKHGKPSLIFNSLDMPEKYLADWQK